MKPQRENVNKPSGNNKINFCAPKETVAILKNLMAMAIEEGKREVSYKLTDQGKQIVLNPALIFTKLAPKVEEKGKRGFLELVKFIIEDSNKKQIIDKKNIIEHLFARQEKAIKSLDGVYQVKSGEFKVSFRLIVGLGASHHQETSMTLHHIYGIPYIPASAVKGVTRHWAVLKFANNDKNIEKISETLEKGEDLKIEVDGISFKDLIDIFGTQEQEGKVIFFDAYPQKDFKIEIDIMNPHYPDYYSGKSAPSDWQNPNPIPFLTVGKNTKFHFFLASKDNKLLEKAFKLLEEALKNYGIGAKTALGYGLFT